MNEQKDIPITDSAHQELRTRFQEVEDEQRKKGIRILWGLVDGFLLYWDKVITLRFPEPRPSSLMLRRRS